MMSKKDNPLKFLVSGHIREPEGYKTIADKQLRISSSYGANPGKKTIAMINAGRKYETIEEIVDDLERIEQ